MRGQFFYLPETVAATPADGQALVDRWWVYHPEKGIVFYYVGSGYDRTEDPVPQCNGSEATVKYLIEKLHPGHEARFVPVVFMTQARREMIRLVKAAKQISNG